MPHSFSSRWGVPDDTYDDKFDKFKNRLILILGRRFDVTLSELNNFSFHIGKPIATFAFQANFSSDWSFDTELYLDVTDDLTVVAKKIEDLLNTNLISNSKKATITKLTNNSNVGIRIAQANGQLLTYPAGVKLLDAELVESPLSELEGSSTIEYVNAIKSYKAGKWNESANYTRRTLEEHLRQVLSNKKGLGINIPILGKMLKDKGVPDHLRSILQSTLVNLDKTYNDNSKHASKVFGESEAEFLLYQTGVCIRLISNLNKGEE